MKELVALQNFEEVKSVSVRSKQPAEEDMDHDGLNDEEDEIRQAYDVNPKTFQGIPKSWHKTVKVRNPET